MQKSFAARRVLALPAPAQPPRGTLECVAGQLLARAAPFDRPAHALMCAEWGLPEPGRPGLLGHLDPPAATAGQRLVGLRRQLRRVTARCGPPSSLGAALKLAVVLPAASELGLRRALAYAGLADGQAGTLLLLALAQLWQLPVPDVLDPPATTRVEIALLARQVRQAGILPAAPVPAGQAPILRAAAVQEANEWLVAVDDRTSQVSRPVRRQLAAVGPLTVGVLTAGARRERPGLARLTERALLTWAEAQPDLTVDGDIVTLIGEPERWLRPTDPPVMSLFADPATTVPRTAILSALVDHGSALPSADVWLTRCSWLRRAERARGRYTLAGSR